MEEKPQTNKKEAKCGRCSEKIPKGEGIKHSSRYYHEDCYKEWRGQADDRTQLIEFIMTLLDLKKPTGMILMQIKRFQDEFGYTYKGMELSLRYFHEILGNEVQENGGIGIIPYIYEDATRQYVQQMKINEAAQNEDNYKNEERVVYISPKGQPKKNNKLIDIDRL
ncbi:hypothetical protein CIL05_07530 [Virgibacillus profundi]|uniref:Uncharacterized protein n=1 Tax=Virgibacillus profundi TaxID=2024555 RepID=A0A2A2IFI9_9BACI|nr:hypothetical protein [Virgibacillus profundi]PAV30312.1 hypothetical protein CIL05_07530 [Virgibacillus profundi]PXY54484.1 hypothetical protein CIT14_07615 [Virgibacillus profundi]